MLFRKKPAEERSPQELEIALQEAEMPQKGLKPFLHKNKTASLCIPGSGRIPAGL